MKVLFIGVGLTHYGNQILNRLNQEPGVEIIDLVDTDGVGHAAPGVHQTRQGVDFAVRELVGFWRKKWSEFPYRSFHGLADLLDEVRPQIIVVSEKYIGPFLHDHTIRALVQQHRIKLILKDIPFRLQSYDVVEYDITSGIYDTQYHPWYIRYLANALKKIGLRRLAHRIRSLAFPSIARARMREHLRRKKEILNCVDAHVNYVEDAYELFASYGVPREKIFITYNSPDTDILFAIQKQIEREVPILPPNPHRILHIGRLAKEKRVDLLIQAVANLKSHFPDIELVIIGYGPEKESLAHMVHHLELEESVRFVGGVYEPELLGKYLLASMVYILAGLGGISINDAMAFGKPIICSVCDGTEKKLVRDGYNGFFFREGDASDLASKLRTLLDSPDLVKTMGEHSTAIIRDEINIHTVIHGYLNAFHYVLRDASNSSRS